jgi:ribonuclease Z
MTPPGVLAALTITLLGTGNPRPSMERFGPSILVEAGAQRILIDAGRGATQRLFQIGRGSLVSGIDLVLFTHLHSDHVVGLPDLWLTGWILGRALPLPVRGPAGTVAMMANLAKAFEFDIRIRRDVDEKFPAAGIEPEARDAVPGVIWDKDGLKIIAFEVDHGLVKPAFGYRFEYGGRVAVFSGDTRFSEELIGNAKGADVLVHEVISPAVEWKRAEVKDRDRIRRIIDHHTTPEDAGRVFARVKPRLAVYSHIVPSPTTAADLIGPTRKTYRGPLEVGRDLMTIRIGEKITVGKRAVIPDR